MVRMFVSYAHVDKDYKEQLENHISVLVRNGVVYPWTDEVLMPGEIWSQSISDAINNAQLIILLISSDFLASDYCYNIEMKDALKRHEEKKAIVVPVILRACDWMDTPFSHLQALPALGKPIKDWPDPDAAYMNVVDGLKKSVAMLRKQEEDIALLVSGHKNENGGNDGAKVKKTQVVNSNTEPSIAGAPPATKQSVVKYVFIGLLAAATAVGGYFFIGRTDNSKETLAPTPGNNVDRSGILGPPPANNPGGHPANNSSDAITPPGFSQKKIEAPATTIEERKESPGSNKTISGEQASLANVPKTGQTEKPAEPVIGAKPNLKKGDKTGPADEAFQGEIDDVSTVKCDLGTFFHERRGSDRWTAPVHRPSGAETNTWKFFERNKTGASFLLYSPVVSYAIDLDKREVIRSERRARRGKGPFTMSFPIQEVHYFSEVKNFDHKMKAPKTFDHKKAARIQPDGKAGG